MASESSSLEERSIEEKRENIKRKIAAFCPRCDSRDIELFMADWFAHSLNPDDLHKSAILFEHQCRKCGSAFWL